MRLNLIQTLDIDGNGIHTLTHDMLASELEGTDGITITDVNPDVVHFIGAWNANAVKAATDAMKKYISIVHTPLGFLSPWYKPASAHVRLSSKATALIASGNMEFELLGGKEKTNLHLISNAVTTATTTPQDMASHYRQIYKDAIEKNEAQLWTEVARKIELLSEKDEAIIEICKNLLYAQYLYQRQSIPLMFLKRLSALMTRSNYDEDRMEEMLRLINLHTFTQHIEYVMMEKAELTEGFMPVMMKKDKTSEKMTSFVTDYQSI